MQSMRRIRQFAAAMLAGWITGCALCVPAWAELGEVPAKSAILIDGTTGTVLYEQNAHERRACGSVTKTMSILLFMEAIDRGELTLEQQVTTSAFANSMGGSEIWLEVGEVMTVDELLKAIVIQSANDATVALAEQTAGSEEAFLDRMNRRAEELGMNDTHYLNTTGFDEEGQYTTAYDIALAARELIRHPLVFEYSTIWMDELRGGKTQLANTNKLLKTYPGITGLKTGTTDDAGNCFCGTAERDGLKLISVVLGCATSAERFSATKTLLDHGFAQWETVTPEFSDAMLTPVPVQGGMQDAVAGTIQGQPTGLLVPKGRGAQIEYKLTLAENVAAPVEQGQKLGQLEIVLENETLCAFPVTAVESVNKITLIRAFSALFRALLCGMI